MVAVSVRYATTGGRLQYRQGWLIERMRYGLLNCDGSRSNRDKGRYQRGPKTRSDFWFRSQSIPNNFEPGYKEANHAMERHTLFAGLVFSFSKIFCDWALVAELMVKAQMLYLVTKFSGAWCRLLGAVTDSSEPGSRSNSYHYL